MYNINWTACWRVTFIAIGLAIFFGMCSDATHGTSAIFSGLFEVCAVVGGVLFVIMCVIRFDDVNEFMNKRK